MTIIDLNELEATEESAMQSGLATNGGFFCGFICGGLICGIGCGFT
ncbi:MAG: hypothetical protein RMK99_02190 [Anaerolineales bacterium]|nr:hypothetical protein [Anaerolineales bacterium]